MKLAHLDPVDQRTVEIVFAAHPEVERDLRGVLQNANLQIHELRRQIRDLERDLDNSRMKD